MGTGSGSYRAAASTTDGSVQLFLWDQLDVDPPTNKLLRWSKTTGLVELVPPSTVGRVQRALISEDGSVTVIEALVGRSWHAFRHTDALGFEPIGPIDGFDSVQPRYVSPEGRTVLGFLSLGESCQDDCSTEAFPFRLTDGNAQRIEPPAGIQCDAGEVAGTTRGPIITTFCNGIPYAHDDGFGWLPLAGVPLAPSSALGGVSGDGSSVFGTTSDATGSHAWRWRSSGELVTLHTASGSLRLDADEVSDDGTVATGLAYEDATLDGFLWVEGAGVTLLPRLVPSSMSAAGDRIVGPDHDAANADPPALISRNGTHTPLHAALSAAGADPGENELTHARITRNGELVYGRATLPDGNERAWLARLPR